MQFQVIYGKFDLFQGHYSGTKLFSQEGRYLGIGISREQKIQWYTPSERRGEKRKEKSDLVQAAHRHNPYGKREKSTGLAETPPGGQARPDGQAEILSTGHANHMAGGKAQSGDKQRPHPAGRDPHPRGRQPGHQGERASVKETSRTQRLQPVH